MIFGIGTDLCAADRMTAKLQKPAFVQRVFSPAEQALLNERGGTHRAETAAANFAAKEAFFKGRRHRPGWLCTDRFNGIA